MKHVYSSCWLLLVLSVALTVSAADGELEPVSLPTPDTQGGIPLMEALSARKTTKAFSEKPVSGEELSNLLWAAFGVNRSDSGKRTAPSAMNCQEIDIYVMLATGTYVYDAKAPALKPVTNRDLRAEAAGGQAKYGIAPVQLVYVADFSRLKENLLRKKSIYAAAHSGFIGQNVYLFCASRGLGTVFREGVDRAALRDALSLREDQEVVFAQTVGYAP